MTFQFDCMPVGGPVTSPFGVVDDAHPQPHTGVDIGAAEGDLIVAPCAATVRDVWIIGVGSDDWEAVFGNSVALEHDGYCTLYAHMQSAPAVHEGQRVEAGDLLGRVGQTGQATGPHLHWGMATVNNPYFQRDLPLLDPLTFLAPAATMPGMNGSSTTVVLDNAAADPGTAGPLAEQQSATIAIQTALNDTQNAVARALAGWRASLERQGQLERDNVRLQQAVSWATANLSASDGATANYVVEHLRAVLRGESV